ncbi:autotransporter outer membrane beta-barrel domain-containing protein [Anaeromicropila populeti]|uniref:Uncharacterized protein n=1 Tax=Anaeromicropila populeti TaxID=37658 RepID=A0A1I6K9W0_9FIRM|nr:hypothetical protein [Anaeromicropila populeti]SFR87977.1 hypothetical protein SAMN05661086_02307 [Anaeromicropila populeti]
MKSKKYIILGTGLALSLMITSCNGNQSTSEGTAATESVVQTDSQYSSEIIYGQVSSLSGSEIILTLGTISSFMDAMGEPPSGETPSGEAPSGETATEEAATEEVMPGEPPSGGGNMPESIFTAGDETYTLTISDESVIYLEGDTETQGTLADIQADDILSVEFDASGEVSKVTVLNAASSSSMGQPGMNNQSSGVDSYDAVKTYTEDTTVDGDTFTSTGTDENAILVQDGAKLVLNNITLDRTSEDSTGGDNSSFYGVGAGLLVTDGTAYVNGGTFTTDAAGGAGIFSYGDGIVYVDDATINTTANTSGGIHVAGGGTLYAWDLNVETNGESAAAVRSDRGSGTMVIDGGSYTSNGVGSPAVYCTADIAINDAQLTATGSEAVCIEGLNSLRLYNSDLTGNMPTNEQNDCNWTVILYQSMSGDSEVGNSTFQMKGGSITSKSGGVFYTTNTECTITLEDVDMNYSDTNEFFLQCTGNTNARGWGSSGSNGSDCVFTGISQDMTGDVIWDSVSNLDFYMTSGSTLTGAFVNDETYAGAGGIGYANLYISQDSKWIVTKDSEVSNLYSEGTIVDESGKTVRIVGEDGTVYVDGTSDITITVGTYSDSVDLTGANTVSDYENYAVEKPEELI